MQKTSEKTEDPSQDIATSTVVHSHRTSTHHHDSSHNHHHNSHHSDHHKRVEDLYTLKSKLQLSNQLDHLVNNHKPVTQMCLERVKEFGKLHGFLDTPLRAKAYMYLFGIKDSDLELNQLAFSLVPTKKLAIADAEIIQADTNRSLLDFPELENHQPEALAEKREELKQILTMFFVRNQRFSYYQGMNCVAEVLMLAFGKSMGFLFLEKIAQRHLEKYLTQEGFDFEVKNQVYITLHILDKELPNYKEILRIDDSGNGPEKLGFIVSWIVTWFSYKSKNLERIFRTFDYLMCTPRHTVSILVSLVIRQLIQRHKLLPGAEEEDVFTAFYSGDLDELNWEGMYKEATLLNELEDYGQLDYRKNKDSRLGKLVNGLKGRIQGGISMLKLSRDDNSNSKSFKDKLKAGISKGIALGSGLFKRKESKSRSRSRDQQ